MSLSVTRFIRCVGAWEWPNGYNSTNSWLDVKRMLIDSGSLVGILYWDAFKGMNMDTFGQLRRYIILGCFERYPGRCLGGKIEILGHLSIMIIFRSGGKTKGIKVKYMMLKASSPYNVIIRRPTFNVMEVAMSIMYLTMKYPLEGGHVRLIKGDQWLARKCYKDSLKLKKKTQQDRHTTENTFKVNLVDLDPWLTIHSLTRATNNKLINIIWFINYIK